MLASHQHDVVYFGAVNLVHDSNIIGAVDVWKCRSCDQLFCEDKRFGVTDLAPEVGLPRVEPDSVWAALICTRNNGSNWTLVQVKPGLTLTHSCTPDTKLELRVGPDDNLEPGMSQGIGQHRLIVLENFVNSAVDVQTGRKHVTTTNAYQALGKPFSFTPPLSATVTQPSRYNILNITSGLFIATGIWTGIMAGLGVGSSSITATLVRALLAAVTGGLLAGAFFLSSRKLWAPLLGLALSVATVVLYDAFLVTAGSAGYIDYALSALLIIDVGTGWASRTRIKNLIERQWHPLDMPAYG